MTLPTHEQARELARRLLYDHYAMGTGGYYAVARDLATLVLDGAVPSPTPARLTEEERSILDLYRSAQSVHALRLIAIIDRLTSPAQEDGK